MSKSIFESQDAGTPLSGKKSGKEKYLGTERRRYNRRLIADRRAEVRFDPNNFDRRQNGGRRETDVAISYW